MVEEITKPSPCFRSLVPVVLAAVVSLLVTDDGRAVAQTPVVQAKNGPLEFSLAAVRIRLEDVLPGASAQQTVLTNQLWARGLIFENATAGDFASGCPGQVDLIGGFEAGRFAFEPVRLRLVDPVSGAPRVTTAFGAPVGSLSNPQGGPFQVTLTAFDVNGNQLGAVTTDAPANGPPPGSDFLGIEAKQGIHRLVLSNGSSASNAFDAFVVGDFFWSPLSRVCLFGDDLIFEPLTVPAQPSTTPSTTTASMTPAPPAAVVATAAPAPTTRVPGSLASTGTPPLVVPVGGALLLAGVLLRRWLSRENP